MIKTATDLFNLNLQLARRLHQAKVTNEVILASLVTEDKGSVRKLAMQEGNQYYRNQHKIKSRKITYRVDNADVEDKTSANNKLSHPFHRVIVDQKVGYISSTPIKITPKDVEDAKQVEFNDVITERLGEQFPDTINNYIKGASNQGEEWIHVFVNEEGEFDYVITPATQIIPIYESRYLKKLKSVVRYYNVEHINQKGERVILIKAEWYFDKEVFFYIEDQDNKTKELKFILDIAEITAGGNPRPHFFIGDSTDETVNNAGDWGRPPFIRLLNNEEGIGDLNYYKELLDEYDLAESDLANTIEDIQDVIWVLKEYEGTDLAEFRKNLKVFKAIKVSGEGGAVGESIDIPSDAVDKMLDRLADDIFLCAMAVNMKQDVMAKAPSGVALEFMYTLLDLKADPLINKLRIALRELLFFVQKFEEVMERSNDFDHKLQDFTFEKSMITNKAEKIQSLAISQGMISEQTRTLEHPYAQTNELELKEKDDTEFTIDEGDE